MGPAHSIGPDCRSGSRAMIRPPPPPSTPPPPTLWIPECCLSDFDYVLPPDLIAQAPASERDASRLLVLERVRSDRAPGVRRYRGILRPGDLLVVNDTRVMPARLFGLFEDGRSVEVLLVRPTGPGLGGPGQARQARPGGSPAALAGGRLEAKVVTPASTADGSSGSRRGRTSAQSWPPMALSPAAVYQAESGASRVESRGRRARSGTPGETERGSDRERYQTVYARADGAVAAPTAGLHFTPALLDRIQGSGSNLSRHAACRTRNVPAGLRRECDRAPNGVGTVPDPRGQRRGDQRRQTGEHRVVAVGTTCVRTLEHAAAGAGGVQVPEGSGEANLFITPGFRFRATDVFLTNFHLPRSTPLMLVAAFAGLENTRQAYLEAIARDTGFTVTGTRCWCSDPREPA